MMFYESFVSFDFFPKAFPLLFPSISHLFGYFVHGHIIATSPKKSIFFLGNFYACIHRGRGGISVANRNLRRDAPGVEEGYPPPRRAGIHAAGAHRQILTRCGSIVCRYDIVMRGYHALAHHTIGGWLPITKRGDTKSVTTCTHLKCYWIKSYIEYRCNS